MSKNKTYFFAGDKKILNLIYLNWKSTKFAPLTLVVTCFTESQILRLKSRLNVLFI